MSSNSVFSLLKTIQFDQWAIFSSVFSLLKTAQFDQWATENELLQYSRTCFERPLKFSTKIGHKRQVTLQKRCKINIKSMELHKSLTS